MYAVVVTGGKQYKVSEGDVLYIEKLNAEADAEVTFDNVLARVRKSLYLLTSQRRTRSARRVIVSHIQRLRLPRLMHND